MSALEVVSLSAGYAGAAVIRDIDCSVALGEVVAVVGRNGVGKSTLVSAVSGTLRAMSGSVTVGGADVTGRPPSRRHARGLRVVRQDRPVFAELTVEENLRLSGATVAAIQSGPFEFLRTRRGQVTGTLSGGEQKMLAITRTLTDAGVICVFDEPTEGLQPSNIHRFADAVRRLATSGVGVLLVEQHLDMALSVADRWHVMEKGRIVDSGGVDDQAAVRIAERMAP